MVNRKTITTNDGTSTKPISSKSPEGKTHRVSDEKKLVLEIIETTSQVAASALLARLRKKFGG